MFRNPKTAAYLYAVQQSNKPILKLSSSMDIGDHPATNRGRVYIITNADSVRFYKNDSFIHEYKCENKEFLHLAHPPVEITDYIGSQIADNEDFTPEQAQYVKDILNESSRFGMNHLSGESMQKMALLMQKYGMDADSAYRLYGKYIGNWGDKSIVFRFEAYKDGKLVKELKVAPFEKRVLTAKVDHTDLSEHSTYDVAAVRVCMTDQNGNPLPYYFGALDVKTGGDIEIIGEAPVILRAGMGGFYVRTKRKPGRAYVTLSADGCESVTINFTITVKGEA